MGPDDLHDEVQEIRTLLFERLNIRGRTLDRQIARAGRLLPKRIRAEAKFLAHADALIKNPKLARMVDARRVDRAHTMVVEHLRSIDPAARRNDLILRTLAVWSLYLFIILGAGLTVAWWQGLV